MVFLVRETTSTGSILQRFKRRKYPDGTMAWLCFEFKRRFNNKRCDRPAGLSSRCLIQRREGAKHFVAFAKRTIARKRKLTNAYDLCIPEVTSRNNPDIFISYLPIAFYMSNILIKKLKNLYRYYIERSFDKYANKLGKTTGKRWKDSGIR